ncbi:MAG: cytochrome c [Acidimicrobiaceae bacterium]|nr:cytochrome c [Acidimicrobiaceae bacterium]
MSTSLAHLAAAARLKLHRPRRSRRTVSAVALADGSGAPAGPPQGIFERLRAASRHRFAGPAGVLALGIAAFSILAYTGADASGTQAAVSTAPADIAAGEVLYTEHCQSCHGVNGVGGNNGSPELITVGAAAADFYLTTGRMPLNNPHDQPLRHRPYFTPDEIRQLDAYIAALPRINNVDVKGPTIPNVIPLCSPGVQANGSRPPAGCVTLSEGQTFFATNCAQCHQAAGSGGMLSKGNVVPSLHNASITQTLEAMRIGPKPMPVFGNNQLNERQASAIAHYIQYLHYPTSPGGLGVGHWGPVAEGFVGIIIGLGALLVASRWIGNRG